MIEEYVKIICDRCGEYTLIKKNGFPDSVASYYVPDDKKMELERRRRYLGFMSTVQM